MKVFKSGTAWLERVGGWGEDEPFVCDNNVFMIKETSSTFDGMLEKPVTDVRLTLGDCNPSSGKRECGIEVESSIGLVWNTNFKPKLIFLS